MSRTQRVDYRDPKDPVVSKVFDSLCRSILKDQRSIPLAERRLWSAPDVAARFVFGAVTDDDSRRIAPVIHRLRAEAGNLLNLRLDRSAARAALGQRLAAARAEFTFRPWRIADSARYAELLGNRTVWDSLPDEYPGELTESMARDLIEISNGWSDRHIVYAVEWRGVAIGQVRLQFDSSEFPDAAEISYWLGAPYWGQGLGTGIVTLFTAESFQRRRDLDRLFGVVLDGNAASMRLLEKAGYRRESFRYLNVTKNGRKRSSHVFGLSRADYTGVEG